MKHKMSLPPLREVPEYVAAVQKLNEINAASAQINERLNQIGAQLVPSSQPSDAMSLTEQIMARAAVQGGRLDFDSLQDERQRLQEHLSILAEGARLQSLAIDRLGAALSHKAFRAVDGRHRELARAAAAALREFDDVQKQEAQFFAQLEVLGYEPSPSMHISWHLVGTCRTLPEQSQLSMRLSELEAYGGPAERLIEAPGTLPSKSQPAARPA
jgi:transcription elongation GreA/GreB family factor